MIQNSKICLLALASVLSGALAVSICAKPGQDDEGQSRLRLKMSTTTMMLCLGSSLPLELEVSNQGPQPVKLDKADLWKDFSYSFSLPDGSGPAGGESSSCIHCQGNSVLLKQGDRFESSFKYPLDVPFFKDAGRYTIKMNYEQISTNELTFELYDCNPQ